MSDWEDFVEAHGYSNNDPDALDKIQDSWEKDETEHKFMKEYYESIKKVENSKKKNYRINSFGFNNFKPFGEKIQSFSKKPITLIYGPNSMGKSSFIHMQSYIRYIFETESFDFENTNMFGDNINLGGFNKFVHKRDKTKSIILEFKFDNCNDAILNYLNINIDPNEKKLKALSLFSKEKDEIVNIIKNSEKYIYNYFPSANKVDFHDEYGYGYGYGSGILYTTSQDVNIDLFEKRKKNFKCNVLYKNELNFLHGKGLRNTQSTEYDKSNPFAQAVIDTEREEYRKSNIFKDFCLENKYIYSGYYEYYPETESQDSEDKNQTLTITDFKTHDFLDNNENFINEQTKAHFISDILIPEYINQAKLLNIMHYRSKENIDNNFETRALSERDIDLIADYTLDIINNELEVYEYYHLLKTTKTPLTISVSIKYDKNVDYVQAKKVQYFIGDEWFETIEEKKYINEYDLELTYKSNHSYPEEIYKDGEGAFSGTYSDRIYPSILRKIPRSIDNIQIDNDTGTFNENITYNNKYELEFGILFLSHSDGYRNLIGAFNDMIHFNKMQYIGPLRFYPERDETIKDIDSDKRIMPDSKSSWSLLKKDEMLRKTINKWLKDPKKLKTPYEIKYRELYDMESSLFNLDFEKLDKARAIVLQNKKKIKKLNLDRYTSEEEMIEDMYDYIIKLGEEESKKNITSNKSSIHQKIEKNLNYLLAFSKLSTEDQYKQVFKKMHVFENIETKEEMVFKDLRNNTQISNRDLGLGISQVLPILISTNTHKNTTIAIEQPELHLHPAVQAELADEFIRSYKENKNEFLIETHSEHLLLRIMKRMRYTAENKADRDKTLDLTPEDVCILYVDADEDSTYIKELRLSKKGKLLDHWPGGFFEEGYKERFQ